MITQNHAGLCKNGDDCDKKRSGGEERHTRKIVQVHESSRLFHLTQNLSSEPQLV